MSTKGKNQAVENEEKVATDIAVQQGGREIEIYDGGEDAGAGLENISRDEMRLPTIRILDPKSPQCKPVEAGGPGAKPGDILNVATGEIYDGKKGLYVIATSREVKYIEYIKREDGGAGGGFVAVHEVDEPFIKEMLAEQGKFKKLQSEGEDGKPHETVQTFSLYCLLSTDKEFMDSFRGVVPFQGMQCKKYTSFIERNNNIRYVMKRRDGSIGPAPAALFAHKWHFTTRYEERGSQSWYGWVLKLAEQDEKGVELHHKESRLGTKDDLYLQAKMFNQLITSGELKADYTKDTGEGETSTRGDTRNDIPMEDTAGGPTNFDDIPE